MAGLFSLGGGGRVNINHHQQEQEQEQEGRNPTTEFPPAETLFWYKNEDVSSYRGLEVQWNQQNEELVTQGRPLEQDLYSGGALGVGVGPSGSCDDQSSSRSGMGMAMRMGMMMMGGSGGRGGISCQDCGNQAKKDCPHMRCRTCCKSRGFHCQTHIRSTWVPAPRRRERQQQLAALQQQQQQQIQLHPENPKRHRDTGLEHEDFPAVVSSPAEFRCVRVSSMDEADEQYAYQTAVNIGGHVFRGVLYDHGPDYNYMAGDESASAAVGGVQPLDLIAASGASALPASAASGGGDGAMVSSSGALVDPSSLYPAPLNTFMAGTGSGTQFFPHPRSS